MLKTGKLDSDLLKQLVFDKITYRSDEVKVRPGIGEDCAVMDFGEYECIMSTDHTYNMQRYSLQRRAAAGDNAGGNAA